MRINKQRKWSLILVLLVLVSCPHLALIGEAQELQPSIRGKFVFLPAYRLCHPAEVIGFGFGKQLPEVLLAQILIGNRSNKTIKAVKLGWKVYRGADRNKIMYSSCDDPPPPVELFLSGQTQLIQIESLAPKETMNIGIEPLMLPIKADKTVFVTHPFLTLDDVDALRGRMMPKAEKYVVFFYVSEIHYDDATTWVAKNN